MAFVIIFSVFALCGWSVAFGSDEIIGQSFYIPKEDLLGQSLLGGYQIFEHVPEKCVGETKGGTVESFNTFFMETASFYDSLSTSTSIAVSTYSFGVTLDATTNSISGSKRGIRGLTFTDYSKTKEVFLEASCSLDLHHDIVSSFEKLPSSIYKPSVSSGWVAYYNFLYKYGSHFVKRVSYGSSIYQYAFSIESSSYTEENFKIKACADLSSTGDTVLNVSICSGVTREQIDTVSSLDITGRFVARGGSLKIRSELSRNRTNELIAQFLNEADNSADPILYKFTPIWDLLSQKYYGTKHYSKVINLISYYLGFKNYPCSLITSMTSDGNIDLQYFRVTGIGNMTFQCVIPREGCQDDTDCRFYNGVFSNDCFCRNDNCVRHMDIISNVTGKSETTAHLDKKSWDDSYHGGCKGHDDDDECSCTLSTDVQVLWTSNNIDPLILIEVKNQGHPTTFPGNYLFLCFCLVLTLKTR